MKEIVGPVIFLVIVFVLVVALVFIYKIIVGQMMVCLRDPGGRELERKKKKNGGYDVVNGDVDSDEEFFVPPTLTPTADTDVEVGELVTTESRSAYSAYSAYDETQSLTQTYLTERGLGRVKFDVEYSSESSILKVHIIEGDNLPSKEQDGATNFRIHLTLLPEKRQRLKTKAQSRYSPNYNETFTFKNVVESQLYTTAVRFRLYGLVGTGRLVGETFLQLADIAKLQPQVIKGAWRAFRRITTKGKK